MSGSAVAARPTWRDQAAKAFFNILEAELESFVDPKNQLRLLIRAHDAVQHVYHVFSSFQLPSALTPVLEASGGEGRSLFR